MSIFKCQKNHNTPKNFLKQIHRQSYIRKKNRANKSLPSLSSYYLNKYLIYVSLDSVVYILLFVCRGYKENKTKTNKINIQIKLFIKYRKKRIKKIGKRKREKKEDMIKQQTLTFLIIIER